MSNARIEGPLFIIIIIIIMFHILQTLDKSYN